MYLFERVTADITLAFFGCGGRLFTFDAKVQTRSNAEMIPGAPMQSSIDNLIFIGLMIIERPSTWSLQIPSVSIGVAPSHVNDCANSFSSSQETIYLWVEIERQISGANLIGKRLSGNKSSSMISMLQYSKWSKMKITVLRPIVCAKFAGKSVIAEINFGKFVFTLQISKIDWSSCLIALKSIPCTCSGSCGNEGKAVDVGMEINHWHKTDTNGAMA